MNRIRDLRVSRQMTQADLSALLNCTKAAVSKYENEQLGLDARMISHLCRIFEVTADYLLCLSDFPSPQLSAEEEELVRAFRAADERARSVVRVALEPFA